MPDFIDPELKALSAMVNILEEFPEPARLRLVEFLSERYYDKESIPTVTKPQD